jgi:hypothetical protein
MDKYKYFLKSLSLAKSPRKRRSILHFATRDEILMLAEVVLNYIAGNIKINTSEDKFKIFSRYKHLFRILGFKGRKSWLKRKQAAKDLGKILIVFLQEVLPVLYDEI